MEKKTLSVKEQKKRKMLLLLPVVLLPFLTMLFWALGGGKGSGASEGEKDKGGVNTILPNPKFKEDSTLNKMSYYDKALMDSIKHQEEIKKDPNYRDALALEDSLFNSEVGLGDPTVSESKRGLNTTSFKGDSEHRVYQKLEALQKAIAQPSKGINHNQDLSEFDYRGSWASQEEDQIRTLEQRISKMDSSEKPDKELKELGGMLENILDIQHPERAREKLRQSLQKQKGKVYSVTKNKQQQNLTSLEDSDLKRPFNTSKNAFYSLEDTTSQEVSSNALEAVVHQTQRIVNGSIVKLRLIDAVFISGTLIPKNSFVFGIAALKGERLEVKISAIRFKNSIFPVELCVYDLDGIGGIYIPGAIDRDVAKASTDRSIQALGIANLEDSWGGQAAGMGVEAAKTLLSKKVKLIKVVLKAGYQVLLYDEKEKNAK
ncbi:conjugative transposon protein TraM [Flavobacterium sp. JAS]|uniref:conjugative transposon protein TraM n=1 Tax=Flavobacterium sp. JAS TaxID=2897329 RepID=UPI001E51B059|nr:conjugative transposon protein TraM [Flavobacterium sp. JAS]MCD0470598.1 conjugative transposon protein TraM [Flavobacterium sp. JAS]